MAPSASQKPRASSLVSTLLAVWLFGSVPGGYALQWLSGRVADSHTENRYDPSSPRIGAVCSDGWISSSTGRGTCSHHGGVREWRHARRVPTRVVDHTALSSAIESFGSLNVTLGWIAWSLAIFLGAGSRRSGRW